jgi:hypothetical protein
MAALRVVSSGHGRPQADGRVHFRKLILLALIPFAVAVGGAALDTRIAAPAGSFPRLMVSAHSDRVVAYPLEAATLNGSSYVFVEPGASAIRRVVFTLDPGTGEALRATDSQAPFDFRGTTASGSAGPLDSSTISAGLHEMRAAVNYVTGRISMVTATFNVPSATSSPISLAPSENSVASTIRPTPTAPPSNFPCAAGGAVRIGVGDDAQSVVNAHAAGTTYIVEAGTHLRNFSVQPKSGDRFCGEPGAVLDGGRSLASAFSGGATNVTLDSMTVREYDPVRQGAAIQPQSRASGWVVRNVSALHNGWAGLLVADGMKILGGHYNDNDELGIGGNAATGILLDGLDGDPATIDGPELARNHTLHEPCGWEAGGMKWDVGQVTIRNAHVHDNDCRGLWADINARGALIEYNLIENNFAEGVFYEISQDAVIRYNKIYRNGIRAAGWYWDAGILVNASFNVEVYGNRLSGNYNGITGVQQDRPDSTPPEHLLDNLHVYDNLICATGGGGHPTGVVADNGANLDGRDISFTRNTIQSSPCE